MAILNIESDEAYQLVKELADLEGKSMTTVVIELARKELESRREPVIDYERMQYFLDRSNRNRASIGPSLPARAQVDALHDDMGLPK